MCSDLLTLTAHQQTHEALLKDLLALRIHVISWVVFAARDCFAFALGALTRLLLVVIVRVGVLAEALLHDVFDEDSSELPVVLVERLL